MARPRAVLLALVLWIGGTSAALVGAQLAAVDRDHQATLHGLPGVHVAIAPLPELVAQDGLTDDHLRADVQI